MVKSQKKSVAKQLTLPQLRRELKPYATKSDVKKALDGYATQRDLELWGGQLQDQMQGFQGLMLEQFIALPSQVEQRLMKVLDERVEAIVEHRAEELLSIKSDEVKLMKDKQADHEGRLKEVEKKVGIR